MRRGDVVIGNEPLREIRTRALEQRSSLSGSVRTLLDPAPYPVDISPRLHQLVEQLRAGR